MEPFWARIIEPSGRPGLNYWEYFAERLAQLANVLNNSIIMDLGTKEKVLIDLQQFQCPQGICFDKTVSFAFGTKPGEDR